MMVIEPIEACIARTPDPDLHWLCCQECERFFHFSRLVDANTNWPLCPFRDCHGYGWDFHIFFWDVFREPEDDRWPDTAAGLRHGMRMPQMDSWYEARRQERIEALVARFEASEEHRGGQPSRYVRPFLKMSGDLCWDLSDPEDCGDFQEDLAIGLLDDLPVWANTAELDEAPRMLAELRMFFAFAERTGAVEQAQEWRRVLGEDALVELFRHTMRHDRRLRPRSPARSKRDLRRPARRRRRRRRRR